MTQRTSRSKLAHQALLLIEEALPLPLRERLNTIGLSAEEVLNALSLHIDKRTDKAGSEAMLDAFLKSYQDILNDSRSSHYKKEEARLKIAILMDIALNAYVPLDKLESLERHTILKESELEFARIANATFIEGTYDQRKLVHRQIGMMADKEFKDRPIARKAFSAIAYNGIGVNLMPQQKHKTEIFSEYQKASKGVLSEAQVQLAASLNLDFISKGKNIHQKAQKDFAKVVVEITDPIAQKLFRDICFNNKEKIAKQRQIQAKGASNSFLSRLLNERSLPKIKKK